MKDLKDAQVHRGKAGGGGGLHFSVLLLFLMIESRKVLEVGVIPKEGVKNVMATPTNGSICLPGFPIPPQSNHYNLSMPPSGRWGIKSS